MPTPFFCSKKQIEKKEEGKEEKQRDPTPPAKPGRGWEKGWKERTGVKERMKRRSTGDAGVRSGVGER